MHSLITVSRQSVITQCENAIRDIERTRNILTGCLINDRIKKSERSLFRKLFRRPVISRSLAIDYLRDEKYSALDITENYRDEDYIACKKMLTAAELNITDQVLVTEDFFDVMRVDQFSVSDMEQMSLRIS